MQAGVGLLFSDVMPIYMIIPRYYYNITMLNSVNCSTVIRSPTVKYLCSWEKPLVKPMAPGSIFYHISFQHLVISFAFYLCFYFTLHLYHKNTKNIVLSYLSDRTLVSDREGIDNPFIALVARIYLFCVGARDSCVASYWIDTLVLKNWGKYLRYCATSSLPLRGKPTQWSRGSTFLLIRR